MTLEVVYTGQHNDYEVSKEFLSLVTLTLCLTWVWGRVNKAGHITYITGCCNIFIMVEVVSARVDEDTRRRMRRLRHVNWSEVVRAAIKEKIREEESRREVDPVEVEEALRLMDQVRRPRPGFDGTEEIRKWRDLRR